MLSAEAFKSMPHWFYTYFVHVLSGRGYQFWSGIGSDVGEVTLLGLVLVWWRNHDCHVHRCWRLQWHPHPVHGHPVCKHHHPDGKKLEAGAHAAPAQVGRHLGGPPRGD
jgi:hypothetical protein